MNKALIIVDIQNDFLPGGALAVAEGDQIIPIVNELQEKFDLIIATQDWHPEDHGSFAANHENKSPGELIDLYGLNQVLWPVHCVQGSKGAEFTDSLDQYKIAQIFPKGTDNEVDSYSGFFDNGKRHDTGLGDFLKEKEITDVYIVGLATDYCVKYTAIDSADLGFNTYVIQDACRGVNLNEGDVEKAIEEMKANKVEIIESSTLLSY